MPYKNIEPADMNESLKERQDIMLKGLYTAYTGMINEQHRMDVMTNNLANADTNGYKKEGSTSQAFDTMLAYKIKDLSEAGNLPKGLGIGKSIDEDEVDNPDRWVNRTGLNLGVKIGENYTDYSEGPMKVTGNTFDFALGGSGFFLIEYTNKAGVTSVKYTRDGNFTMDAQGNLVTQDGDFVLDQDRRHIRLDPNEKEIGTNVHGDIYQAGNHVATIGVVDFEDYDMLEHFGENFFQIVDSDEVKSAEAAYRQARSYRAMAQQALNIARAQDSADVEEREAALRAAEQREAEAQQTLDAARGEDDAAKRRLEQESDAMIRAGYLETSNVSIVTEMVNMIAIQRQYDSNQKVITTYDESLDIAVNQLGKVR